MNEHEKAKQNIPEGYEVVTDGAMRSDYLVWNCFSKVFEKHVEPRIFQVENYICVIRPIKPETKETF